MPAGVPFLCHVTTGIILLAGSFLQNSYMKPRVICHMMCSVDGRILTKNWGRVLGTSEYERIGNTFGSNAWMCGRETMEQDFASSKPLKLKRISTRIPKEEDFVANAQATSFAIAIDRGGKLHWEKNTIGDDHIISILTERVSNSYLGHLREMGISYIVAGRKDVDFKLAIQKLGKLFPVKTLLLEGGGHINGGLLKAGQIDELSILYVPVADGTPGTTTLFEVTEVKQTTAAAKLKLSSVKRLENDVVWMRYTVNK